MPANDISSILSRVVETKAEYFTLIAVLAYAYAVYSAMTNIYPQEGFSVPLPSDTLVALSGISLAAYLTSKTTQHS